MLGRSHDEKQTKFRRCNQSMAEPPLDTRTPGFDSDPVVTMLNVDVTRTAGWGWGNGTLSLAALAASLAVTNPSRRLVALVDGPPEFELMRISECMNVDLVQVPPIHNSKALLKRWADTFTKVLLRPLQFGAAAPPVI